MYDIIGVNQACKTLYYGLGMKKKIQDNLNNVEETLVTL